MSSPFVFDGLKMHLKARGLTYVDVARALRISEATVKRIFVDPQLHRSTTSSCAQVIVLPSYRRRQRTSPARGMLVACRGVTRRRTHERLVSAAQGQGRSFSSQPCSCSPARVPVLYFVALLVWQISTALPGGVVACASRDAALHRPLAAPGRKAAPVLAYIRVPLPWFMNPDGWLSRISCVIRSPARRPRTRPRRSAPSWRSAR